jgi:hypothetical protein
MMSFDAKCRASMIIDVYELGSSARKVSHF